MFSCCGPTDWRSLGLALALTAFTATIASAQTLLDVGAANSIGAEMEAGRAGRAAQSAPKDPADADSAEAPAADGAPAPAARAGGGLTDQWGDEHSIFRQTGPALSWWKMLLGLGVFFAWVRSGDWVNRDAQIYELGHETWNAVMVAPFVVAMLVTLLIPNFVIGFALMVLAWFVPFVLYVVKHNNSVEDHQTVFTSSWFRFQAAEVGKLFGMKVKTEQKADYMRGPQVDLAARGDDERVANANLLTARQSPGYVHVKELVADMVARGSSRVLLDYTPDDVGIRHMIDGVWHNGEGRDRESGDVMLAVMKQLANLNVNERKKKQAGEFGAEYEKKKYDCEVTSQGVKSGERVIVSLKGGTMQTGFTTLEGLGMRSKLREQWAGVMGADRGLVVISAMPEGGLTTLTDVALLETDRLLRDFMAVEDVSNPETEIENVAPHYYDAAQGQSPSEIIPSLSRKYPNVWVMRDFVDAESAKLMMDEVIDLDRLVITTVHAKEAPEACLRLLKKKTPHKEFTQGVIGVLNMRLIRTLCEDCKVEYEAEPRLLKKLGIPSGKVTKFYQPPKPEDVNKPCPTCDGIGYRGRTGLFELLLVDDQFREKLLKEPKIEVLRKSARAAGMRTLQEEGVLLVARGTTSLSELSRVLKG